MGSATISNSFANVANCFTCATVFSPSFYIGCQICGKILHSPEEVHTHLNTDHAYQPGGSNDDNSNHQDNHENEEEEISRWKCQYCSRNLSDEFELSSHIIDFHMHDVSNVKTCPACAFRCLNGKLLYKHFLKEHKKLRAEYQSHLCYICKIAFTSKEIGIKHINEKHKDLPKAVKEKLKTRKTAARECKFCGHKVLHPTSLVKHIKRNHRDLIQLINCHLCHLVMVDEDCFFRHLRQKHFKEFQEMGSR